MGKGTVVWFRYFLLASTLPLVEKQHYYVLSCKVWVFHLMEL